MRERTAYVQRLEDHHPATTSVVEAFERQVDADPQRDAIRRFEPAGGGSVSFDQLDTWSNAIAWELIDRRGTKPEPVPLAILAPDLMLAAALGALKAGKFYVAVNPLHPAPRVQRVLEELDAPLLLCDRRGEAAARHGVPVLPVEETVAERTRDWRPGLRFDDSRLAYVLYTSGSTGRPRGVAQSRRDMLHNVKRHRALEIGCDDCVTLLSADGFVAAVSNPYVALLGGAALAPYSFRDEGVDRMLDWLKATGVTVLYAFPSFLRQLAVVETTQLVAVETTQLAMVETTQLAAVEPTRVHDGLRLAYLGGESVLPSDLAAARRLFPSATLSIGLNSSETGLTCLHLIPPGSALPDPVPAGRPVVDIEVAVLNENGRAPAPGESGEIEIRSEYVRPRYWGCGDIHEDGAPAPAFRTGDRGRIDADGIVYHLGRVDGMVKIRGFRVETAEVEAVISALPEVAEVAVLAAGEDPAAPELVACVVARGPSVAPAAVRSAVARELPAAMIPTRVLILDALPRTLNGKLDRGSLARIADPLGPGATTAPTPRMPPGDVRWAAVEHRIAEIWGSELGVAELTAEESFFAVGGTSITAVSVVARVRREFGVQVPLAVLFETPTVTALAATVIEMQGEKALEDGHAAGHVVIRPAREADFPTVCALVNHYIKNTTFNFRTEPQTPAQWITEWSAARAGYPWLVASVEDVVTGIAYAGQWKGRPAYDWCAEVTVYVARDAQRMGVGRALYRRLLELLDGQGYHTEIAVIGLPNEPSVALHEACGFRHRGTLNGVGHKHGSWLDVGFWQRGPRGDRPPAPVGAIPLE